MLNTIIVTNKEAKEEGCRPSVNILFRSVANIYGGQTIAIILTGMGADGSRGLGPLFRKGANIILQDEKKSVVWGMPGAASKLGYHDKICPLTEIPNALTQIFTKNGAA